MSKEKKEKCERKGHFGGSSCGGVYGVGLIGALIYFISNATGFWVGVLGVMKSLVWPAFIVYELLKFFHL